MSSLNVCCLPLKNYTSSPKSRTQNGMDKGPFMEATFHAACVQLVSLNFALHEARCGSPIHTEPVRMRTRRRNLSPTSLEKLRDMYYKSVERGAETLGRIERPVVQSQMALKSMESSRTDSGNFSM